MMRSLFIISALLSLVSCVPLQDSTLGLSEVVWQPETPKIYLGSPSLLEVNCSSAGGIQGWIASHDFFGSGFKSIYPRNASIFFSEDKGDSWKFLSYVPDAYWATLFSVGNQIYLLGTSTDVQGRISIHKSSDCGETWTGAMLSEPCYATGPTPVAIDDNNFIYRAMEYWRAPQTWGTDFEAMVMYAPSSSSLLSPSSWTLSNPLPFNLSWIPEGWNIQTPGYLEGNAVIGPDGEVFNSAPLANKAVILKLDKSSNSLVFQQFIDFPGGNSKFTIRRDPVTNIYLTLSNNVGNLNYTGFHYVDWQFSGDDIFYAVRTGYRGANSYHNSNRLTVKWLYNFRSLFTN